MDHGIFLSRGAADASTSEWLDKRLPGNESLQSILAGSSKNIALAHVLSGIAKENGAVLSFFDPKKEEQKLSQLKEDKKNIPLQSELLEKLKKSYISTDRIYSELLSVLTSIIKTPDKTSIYPSSQIPVFEMVNQYPDFLSSPVDGSYPERVTRHLSDIIQHVKESFHPLEKLKDSNIQWQEYYSPGIEFADLSQKLSTLDQLKNYSELSSVLSVPDVSSISISSSPSSFSNRTVYHETNIMGPLDIALNLLRGHIIAPLLSPESIKGFDSLSSILAKVSYASSMLNLSQFDIKSLAFALALLDWKFECVKQIVDLELMKDKERYYALSRAELKIRTFGNFILVVKLKRNDRVSNT